MGDCGKGDRLGSENQRLLLEDFDLRFSSWGAGIDRGGVWESRSERPDRSRRFVPPTGGKLRCDASGVSGHIGGAELVHGDNRVGDIQVVPAPAQDDDATDAPCLPQGSDLVDQGRNGLAFLWNQRLHSPVADHEVGGRRVFVDEQGGCAGLDCLDNTGRLTRGTRSIGCRECSCSLSLRQCTDEGGDIDPGHGTAVLRPNFYGGGIGHHELPAVPVAMVVHAPFDSPKQGTLPMVPASHDQRDATWNRHPIYLTGVREIDFRRQSGWCGERDRTLSQQGSVIHSAFSR